MEELEIFPILAMLPNIEPDCLKLEDLALETQIRLLEAFKSIKDCEKGKIRGRGFSNASKINAGRNSSVFTDAEQKAKEIFDSFGLSYVHEARISLKDAQNRPHHFKLDFLFPDCRIDLEISPEFHKTYKLVVKRDLLRERLLKKAGIRQMTISAPCKKLNGTVKCLPDVNELRNFARMVKAAQKSPECLTYYLKDVNGRVPMEEIKNSLSFQSKSLTELFQMKKEAQNMSIDEKVAYFAAIRRKCSIIQSWKRKNELQIKLKTLKLGIIRGNWTYKAFHSFYFHGTQLSKLERIKAEGLKPNKLTGECNYPDLAIEAVYLTTDYHEAKCWAVWNRKDRYSSNPEKAFVIWVPKSKIDQTKLEHDRNLETSPAFEFHGIIEPPFGITDVSDFNSDW